MSIMTPIEKARLTFKPGRLCPTGCMLLGNTNVNYDPDRHITDKNPTCLDWGHCFSFDPVYEGKAMFDTICYIFKVTLINLSLL